MLKLDRYLKSACLIGGFAALMTAQGAHAESHEVQLKAYVPIECEADLQGSLTQLSSGSFSLGRINQFCNTPFSISVAHAAAPQSAMFQYRGNVASAGTGSTVLASTSAAANDSVPLYLHGVNATEAATIAGSLVLAVTPLGV